MILSNEPGYYKPGAFGIRIENLVEVVPSSVSGEAGREFLELATLTVCPIDTRPINTKLLTDDERRWLNRYHRRVDMPFAERISTWVVEARVELLLFD